MKRALVLLCAMLGGCSRWGVSVPGKKDIRTPLERAAQQGDLPEVQRLLALGVAANDRAGLFGSPLNSAALRNHNAEVIRALIAAGADPNGRGTEGDTCWASPLRHAAVAGDLDNIGALLDLGASLPKSRCSNWVVGWLKAPVIDLLVKHGLDILTVDELGRNELHHALAPPAVPNVEGIEYLVRAGVQLNAGDHEGKTPLAYWRKPRDFEAHRLRVWLVERLSGDPEFRKQRDSRARISAFLERSGAVL